MIPTLASPNALGFYPLWKYASGQGWSTNGEKAKDLGGVRQGPTLSRNASSDCHLPK